MVCLAFFFLFCWVLSMADGYLKLVGTLWWIECMLILSPFHSAVWGVGFQTEIIISFLCWPRVIIFCFYLKIYVITGYFQFLYTRMGNFTTLYKSSIMGPKSQFLAIQRYQKVNKWPNFPLKSLAELFSLLNELRPRLFIIKRRKKIKKL